MIMDYYYHRLCYWIEFNFRFWVLFLCLYRNYQRCWDRCRCISPTPWKNNRIEVRTKTSRIYTTISVSISIHVSILLHICSCFPLHCPFPFPFILHSECRHFSLLVHWINKPFSLYIYSLYSLLFYRNIKLTKHKFLGASFEKGHTDRFNTYQVDLGT